MTIVSTMSHRFRRTARQACLLLLLFLPFFVFSQPIDINRVNALDEFHWGVNAFHQGYTGKALQSFEEALRLAPDETQIKSWLARAYFRLGLEDTALSLWKDIVRSGKGTPLLEYIIHVVETRSGLGKELAVPDLYVVNYALDANAPGSRLFKRPSAVLALPDGNYFVVAYGSNEVLSLNANSLVLSRFLGGTEPLNHPFGMAAAGGQYFLSEFEGNVVTKFDRNFVKLKSFGGKGTGEGKLLGPQFLAVDESGYLYVTDWGNRRVSKFDLDGNYVLSFGTNSPAYPYQKFEPTGIAAGGGRVYVSDQFMKMVMVFDANGNYLDGLGEGTLESPEGLLLYDPNTLLVADGARIMGLSLKEEAWKVWSDVSAQAKRLLSLALTPNNDVLAADFDANKVFFIADASSLYTGFFVQVDRVDSSRFPEVMVDLSVEDTLGRPIVGLASQNLFVTEANRPVKDVQVVRKNTEPDPLSVVLVVEDSPALDKYDRELELCIENVMGVLPKSARVKIVFARQEATLEADAGTYDPAAIEALVRKKGDRAWKLDAGLKTAVAELSPDRGRRAVIFLTSGAITDSAFGYYSLQECARALRNNRVRFYPVYLGALKKSPELEYILGEAGGTSYIYFDPDGLRQLLSDLTKADNPTYVVRYTSTSLSDFGRRYIPLEVQVLMYKKSGRDESGYYAPLVGK
jgi:DNA-binding beta-propeller fold protein YncE